MRKNRAGGNSPRLGCAKQSRKAAFSLAEAMERFFTAKSFKKCHKNEKSFKENSRRKPDVAQSEARQSAINRHSEGNCPFAPEESKHNNSTQRSEARQSRKAAFSLAEAMITLLMISIILAAMAPIMSKKMRLTQTGFSSATKVNKKQWYKATPGTYEFPTSLGVNTYTVTMAAGGGGGGNAAKANVSVPVTSTAQQSFTIPDGVNSINLTLIGAGGGGGGGNGGASGGGSKPLGNSEFCVMGGADNGQDLIVKQKNVGDFYDANLTSKSGKYVASSTTVVPVNSNCSGDNCCWYGQTAGSCDSVNTSYSGCTRTMCTWTAANATCAQMGSGWRLPTLTEMQKWRITPGSDSNLIASYKGGSGIDLCDMYTNSGSAQCLHGFDRCPGTNYYKTCNPFDVWSSTIFAADSPWYAYYFMRYNGSWYHSSGGVIYQNSARCVQTRSGACPAFTPYAGGGGGSAAQASVSNIAVTKGDRVVVQVGTGGSGGAAGTAGGNGTQTTVTLYNSTGGVKGAWWMDGAGGGGGATTSSHGAGGYGVPDTWGPAGITKISGSAGASGNTSNGGQGGNIVISGTTYQGGTGGSSSSINGQPPSNTSGYGAGGGGGFASDATNKGSGGKGANGFVRIDYTVMMPGGGGGAGSSIKSYDIKTGGEEKISVTVGAGGNATTNGTNTSFGTYAVTEGGKSGGNSTALSTNYGLDSKPGIGGLGGTMITTIPAISQSQKDKWVGKPGLSGFSIAGGTGGASFFGIGACGGMSNGVFKDCTETNQNGLTAPNFDFAKLQDGGAGGGGAGYNGQTTGIGGKGGDGFIIVEWE